MSDPTVEQRIGALRADVVRGSSEIARDAAEILRDAALESPASSSDALTAALTAVSVRILEAQPAMAPLVSLARCVLSALGPPGPLGLLRARAAEAAGGFGERLVSARLGAARRMAEMLPRRGAVLTLSASSAVQAALTQAAQERPPLEVVCLESRPMNEGRALAAALAASGARVTLAVDAAAESVMDGCGVVLLGADSVGDAGVVNKIGSAALAHAAARRGLPVYVVADCSKLLPPGFPQRLDDDRPASEVWEGPGRVLVWNRYFELVPPGLVTRVVLEDGAFSTEAVDARRRALGVPSPLRDWARGESNRAAR